MIEVYKIMSGIYNNKSCPKLLKLEEAAPRQGNRGHKLKRFPLRANRNARKCNFSTRIVGIWNSLSCKVVTSTSVNIYKNRIDKFWANQDVYYNFDANLTTGTGADLCTYADLIIEV